MQDEPKSDDGKKPPEHESHALLWSIVTVFIVLAIGGMWAIDFYFSPEMNNPSSLSSAVGK